MPAIVETLDAACSSAPPSAVAARARMADHPEATKGAQRIAYNASMPAFLSSYRVLGKEQSPLVATIPKRR
eukprot:9300953-Pyramimonas_sp.AAC.1